MKKNMIGLAAIMAVLAVLTPRAWAVISLRTTSAPTMSPVR